MRSRFSAEPACRLTSGRVERLELDESVVVMNRGVLDPLCLSRIRDHFGLPIVSGHVLERVDVVPDRHHYDLVSCPADAATCVAGHQSGLLFNEGDGDGPNELGELIRRAGLRLGT